MANKLLILAGFSLVIIVCIIIIRKISGRDHYLKKAWRAKKGHREKIKNEVLGLFKTREKITNKEVVGRLGVSSSAATEYLDELEKENKVIQNGQTGKGVFYTKRPGL